MPNALPRRAGSPTPRLLAVLQRVRLDPTARNTTSVIPLAIAVFLVPTPTALAHPPASESAALQQENAKQRRAMAIRLITLPDMSTNASYSKIKPTKVRNAPGAATPILESSAHTSPTARQVAG